MNRIRLRWAVLAVVFGFGAAPLFAQGQKQQTGTEYWFRLEKELGLQTRYSVDMEIQAMGMVMPSKTYRLDGLSRTETTVPIMNMRMVALELEENGKKVHYSLFPDKKKYCLETGVDEEKAGKAPAYKITETGTEVFEGVSCKKRRLSVTLPEGGTQEMDMLFSPAQKNMPVKMTATVQAETEPGQPPMTVTSVVLFKNYVFAAPAASLFKIPSDYTRAADMNAIMLEGFGGFGAPQPGAAAKPGAAQTDLSAMIRQAQEEAAREEAREAAEAKKNQEPGEKAANESLQQGIQGLRRLFGN